jgi:hypothetical protein
VKYLLLFLLTLWGFAGTANELYFQRAHFKSNYEDGKGKVSLTMTETPGYAVISRNLNSCNFIGICQNKIELVGYNLYDELYRLVKVSEVSGKLHYKAVPVEFGQVEKKFYPRDARKLYDIKIDCDSLPKLSASFNTIGDNIAILPLTLNMTISTETETKEYVLNYSDFSMF